MSVSNEFGAFLRNLRKKHDPEITQEQLADIVGKKKMTISQIENGKNAPPQGEFLQQIAKALDLTSDEKTQFYDLAAVARGAVPNDILDYFNKHAELRNAIRRAQKIKLPNSAWKQLIKEQ